MKINAIRKFLVWSALGLSSTLAIWAADATPENKTPPSPPTMPQNPFGPKPTPPTETSAPTPTPAPMADTSTAELSGNESFVPIVRAMLLQRFDKNKDGKLDATELTEARTLFSNGRGRAGRAGRAGAATGTAATGPLFGLRALIMSNFGKGVNGTLDAGEIAELHTFLFGPPKEEPKATASLDALRQQIIQQFDKNGDGKLDEAETWTAKAFLLQMIDELDKNNLNGAASTKRPVAQSANSANDSVGTTAAKQ